MVSNHGLIFKVVLHRDQEPKVTAGLGGLQVLKTTQSAFVNFVSDEYRSLPDMKDRIFSTVVDAKWTYNSNARPEYEQVYEQVKTNENKRKLQETEIATADTQIQKCRAKVESLTNARISTSSR